MSKQFALDDGYVDVATRIREFRERYPEGSLQPADPTKPFDVLIIAGKTYLAYCAAAYRSADDTRPGIGTAWEPVPGPTPFTKDSELQNAETAAWGRAIVAALAADTKRVASRDEIESARSRDDVPPLEIAPKEQLDDLVGRVRAAGLEEHVKAQRFPWPWSTDACAQIEQMLAAASPVPFPGEGMSAGSDASSTPRDESVNGASNLVADGVPLPSSPPQPVLSDLIDRWSRLVRRDGPAVLAARDAETLPDTIADDVVAWAAFLTRTEAALDKSDELAREQVQAP